MNFYRIYNSHNKDVGYFPQVINTELSFSVDDKNSSTKLSFSKANSSTLWPVPKLYNKAKKTDLVSISSLSLSNKLFISEKLYLILSKATSEGIQFIKSKLITKKGNNEYWIVNPYLSEYSFLDMPKCEFVYTDSMIQNGFESISFDSASAFIDAYNQNKIDAITIGYPKHRPLVIKKLAIKQDCCIHFFSVSGVHAGIGYYISEKLKTEIEEQNCTGIVFTGVNEKPY